MDIFLTVTRPTGSSSQVNSDPDLAVLYVQAANEIAAKAGVPNDMTVSRLMQQDGVITVTEAEMVEESVIAACEEAA